MANTGILTRFLLFFLLVFLGLGGLPTIPWDGWQNLSYGPASLVGLVALLGVVVVLLEQS